MIVAPASVASNSGARSWCAGRAACSAGSLSVGRSGSGRGLALRRSRGRRSCGSRRGSVARLDSDEIALADPDLNQRRHGLDICVGEQAVDATDVDEVDEAGVELSGDAEMVEVEPVRPVEVSVAAEHLFVHVLDFRLEGAREARGLAKPGVRVGRELRRAWKWWGALVGSGWEDAFVLNLASDPSLDVLDVRHGWDVDGVAVDVDPGVDGAVKAC